MPRRRLILRLVLVAAALGALAVGWWAYWQTAADRFQASLEGWAAQQRALGRTVEYGAPVFSGFPFAIRAEIADPRIAMPAQGFGWQGPTIEAEASPLDPLTIELHAPGEHLLIRVVGSARSELQVQAGALDGTLDLGRTALQSLALAGSNLRATDSQGRTIVLDGFSIAVEPAESPPATYADRLLAFDLDLEWLVLPPIGLPLGERIDAIAVTGRVMGPIPPGAPAAALEVWRRAGGTLEIDDATGRWGPVRFAGDGTFALDEQLQPQGAASVTIAGYEPAIDAMVASGFLTAEQGEVGKTMLGAFAREPSDGGLKEVRLPVTLQNRKLSVGPLEFARLPAVEWPDR